MKIIISQIIIYFFLYCVCGYICEVLYCSIPAKRFVNRGFLYGPYLPIYGTGAIAIIFFLEPLKEYPIILFFAGILVTTILEYATSFLLEKIFHMKLWDYSKKKFNIHGRVCLLNSFLFGILGIVMVYGIHPFMEALVQTIPSSWVIYIALAIVIIMGVDITISVFHITAFRNKLSTLKAKLKEAELQRISAQYVGLGKVIETITSEIEKLNTELRKTGKRVFDAFPGITNTDLAEQFEKLKEAVRAYRVERKELRKAAKTLRQKRKHDAENEG